MKFTLSAPIRPFYESKPYRPSPATREFIWGKIHSAECKCATCRKAA